MMAAWWVIVAGASAARTRTGWVHDFVAFVGGGGVRAGGWGAGAAEAGHWGVVESDVMWCDGDVFVGFRYVGESLVILDDRFV